MRLAFFTLLILCLAACAGLGGEPEIAATTAPVSAEISQWQPDIQAGAHIFAERCTECHGEPGDGRGTLVAAGSVPRPLNMTDYQAVSAASPLSFFQVISEGRIENLMPPWQDALSAEERWDVALFAYSLRYTDETLDTGGRIWEERCAACSLPASPPPALTDAEYAALLNREFFDSALEPDEALAAAAVARVSALTGAGATLARSEDSMTVVRGRVAQGTAGAELPAGIPVQLRYDGADTDFERAATVADDEGAFAFVDIPIAGDAEVVISALYAGRVFSQRLFAASEATLTVYAATDDPRVVTLSQIDLFIEPVKLTDIGRGLIVTAVMRFRNDSDRIFSSGRGFDDGREAALLLQNPAGARLISGEAGGRYVVIKDVEGLPDSVIDAYPVAPGDGHQIALEYFLPYDKSMRYEQRFNNRVDAAVRIALDPRLQLESGDFPRVEGAQSELDIYEGALARESGATLTFDIRGDPFATSSDDAGVVTSEDLPALLVGGGALIAAILAGAAAWRRRMAKPARGIDGLARELARLDADHDQGRVNHDLWHQRRRELKDRMARLMTEDADSA